MSSTLVFLLLLPFFLFFFGIKIKCERELTYDDDGAIFKPFFRASARCCFIRMNACRSSGVNCANFALSRSRLCAFSSSFLLNSESVDSSIIAGAAVEDVVVVAGVVVVVVVGVVATVVLTAARVVASKSGSTRASTSGTSGRAAFGWCR